MSSTGSVHCTTMDRGPQPILNPTKGSTLPRPHRTPKFISRLALLLMVFVICSPASAQDATPSAIDNADPATITEALSTAEPPARLPGDLDDAVELETWEEYYGDPLANTEGAWLLTGSLQFPLATMIVFSSSDNAEIGLGEYRGQSSEFTVGELDAWTVADRGKWICITATGPMIVIGQALPVDMSEPEDEVEQRSCDVVEATLTWLAEDVLEVAPATPSASPTSDPRD